MLTMTTIDFSSDPQLLSLGPRSVRPSPGHPQARTGVDAKPIHTADTHKGRRKLAGPVGQRLTMSVTSKFAVRRTNP